LERLIAASMRGLRISRRTTAAGRSLARLKL
jgi:hypothetical protein